MHNKWMKMAEESGSRLHLQSGVKHHMFKRDPSEASLKAEEDFQKNKLKNAMNRIYDIEKRNDINEVKNLAKRKFR